MNSFIKAYSVDYVHAYADDNQLYISFKPGSSASELEAVTALQDYIIHIKTCMTADKRKLPYSPLFSRDLNFAIAEKNCVCREFNFAKLTIK